MTPSLWTIILAAGQGSRLKSKLGETRKQFLPWAGAPLYWQSVLTMSRTPELAGLVLVFPAEELASRQTELRALMAATSPGVPILTTSGGNRRQDSVRLGLDTLPRECTHVFIHDSARPFFSASLVQKLLRGLTDVAGVVPALAVTDTIKEVEQDRVVRTLRRERLLAVQTPQLFVTELLRHAHARAVTENWEATDDASLLERDGHVIGVALGEETNIKITNPRDLDVFTPTPPQALACTGFGYDVHAYGGNRPLVLGGIPIAGAPHIKAHSDGDVLLHALCDAILGCMGQGDIGEHFSDTDARFENIASGILLSEIMDQARAAHLRISHVDLTVIAQTPRLAPHKAAIRSNVARLMALADDQVNLKATTEEHLGFTGRKEGIKAVAVVTASRVRS